MRRAVVLLVIALSAAARISDLGAQQLYRWTDEKGRVHVTDTPPPPSAKGVHRQSARVAPADSGQQTSFELSLAIKDYPVTLYTSPMCKEPCAHAREHLNKRGVPFKEIQVWDVDSNEELKRVSGANQVPTMVVGASVQKGFEPGTFDALLDSARYPKAGAVPARAQAAPPPPEGYAAPAEAEPPKAEPLKPPAAEPQRPRGPYAPR